MSELAAEGPYFDDLSPGDVFDTAPPTTLTEGAAAVHGAIVGERLRLALDAPLGRRVTGDDAPPAPPSLVWDLAVGQSTPVTHHVRANLFYRGLAFRRLPSLGDTLRTRTEVVGLRQNSPRPDRAPTGLVALRITTVDQDDRTVLDFWRCAMLPLRDGSARTGHDDDLGRVGRDVEDPAASVAAWRLEPFRASLPPSLRRDVTPGTRWRVVGGDVVSSAPELARLTHNIARTHHDDEAGTRLVYGGHTIGLALTQAVRALPEMVTVLAWQGCDHTGPVREGDTLESTVEVAGVRPGPDGGRLADLRSRVTARSGPGDEHRDVLDWRYTALLP
ncbi:MaoC family dehydratase [Blastococcus sp. VKM Ac-2987]|uniref:MaoC family dehydratase n=1 Tax=Blastococcus sp. VKM Ac-2987 TaxID=3004141 RepID=UPI0022ABA401|nr:MaoC family dehydratase [Blastococcus sp. VKM Ac-2987]MCZ2857864.1 MaoC family dehydratase [Blastococcus sp. VKM Ac-2987]